MGPLWFGVVRSEMILIALGFCVYCLGLIWSVLGLLFVYFPLANASSHLPSKSSPSRIRCVSIKNHLKHLTLTLLSHFHSLSLSLIIHFYREASFSSLEPRLLPYLPPPSSLYHYGLPPLSSLPSFLPLPYAFHLLFPSLPFGVNRIAFVI